MLPCAGDQKSHSSSQRQAPEYGGKRNLFLSIFRGVNRPEIKDLFSMGVSDALIGEGQNTQNHQQHPSQRDRFHIVGSELRTRSFGPE
jgi:hypothetical protein